MPNAALYESIANEYDARRSPHQDLWDRLTLARIRPFLSARKKLHILDAGSGTGRMSMRFLAQGHRVTLLDPSEAMLAVARDKAKEKGHTDFQLVTGQLEDLPFPDESFDMVFSDGDPLSYCIGTQREAADEILRVLRPGAGFYVSCDNRWSAVVAKLLQGHVSDALRCAQDGRSVDPYGFAVHAFDPSELRHLFEDAGAVDVEVTGKGHLSTFIPAKILQAPPSGPGPNAIEDIEQSAASDPLMSGMAAHLQVTGRRRGGPDDGA